MFTIRIKARNTNVIVPEHESPSPVKPGLHVQLKFPAVFVQVAFSLQSWIPVLHSSISEYQERDTGTQLTIFKSF